MFVPRTAYSSLHLNYFQALAAVATLVTEHDTGSLASQGSSAGGCGQEHQQHQASLDECENWRWAHPDGSGWWQEEDEGAN